MVFELVVLFWAVYFFISYAMHYFYNVLQITSWFAPYSFWNRYPFVCHKCATTWVLVGAYISSAYILGCFWFGFWGVLLSAGNGYALYYTEKQLVE